MVLSDFYSRMQEGVFSQNLEGTYVKRRPSRCSGVILAFAIVNLALALSSAYTYFNTKTTNIQYNSDIQSTVFLPKGTSYIYISVDGIYQNYLSYTKSINFRQLKGKTTGLNLSAASPFDYNGDKPYYPAGAIAATYFQDIVTIDNLEIESDNISRGADMDLIGFTSYLPDQISMPINWTSYTNLNTTPLNTFTGSGLPILNERFVNWITLSPFSSFKKLWGRVNVKQSGEYNLTIMSSYGIATKKSLFICEKSILGIPNHYASLSFLIAGILSILAAIYLSKYGY
ncbi:uncharacterized protein VICG_01463 [Vittaforma corneae ATCC 50505]|uniref:Cell cycle control protein n=1 Tax=Vittaforma corneae (strain ATCC 50505) TaxID=993615 RepID=L2GLG0_VITCO|nr:uncharacterized protein VICG_01463 [Vittaforma corneae ATCC 50505]ELA41479.1 hypothetical protein VICG_01463 [Vittaforma corneae ATCC 50505]